jgi:hypothetical protein
MSSKGRGADSVESDFYATPAWATRAILSKLPLIAPEWTLRRPVGAQFRILESTAGKGAIVEELRAFYPYAEIDAVELDRGRVEQLRERGKCNNVVHGDLADFAKAGGLGHKYDLILTNPPFTIATNIIEHGEALLEPYGISVYLLRQAILASDKRVPWWRKRKAFEGILPKRPQFARSLKCDRRDMRRIKNPCGFAVIQELEAPVPPRCPGCGDALSSTSSDSADYAWFVFGAGVERTWDILEIEK